MNVTGLHWWSVNIAWRHQAITWAIVDQDLRRHMSSLGHNELIKNVVWKHAARFGSTTYSRHDLSYYPGGEPTKIVANVITFEMWWSKCNGNVMGWNICTHQRLWQFHYIWRNWNMCQRFSLLHHLSYEISTTIVEATWFEIWQM